MIFYNSSFPFLSFSFFISAVPFSICLYSWSSTIPPSLFSLFPCSFQLCRLLELVQSLLLPFPLLFFLHFSCALFHLFMFLNLYNSSSFPFLSFSFISSMSPAICLCFRYRVLQPFVLSRGLLPKATKRVNQVPMFFFFFSY